MRLKLLCVHPGATVSVVDVHDGLKAALARAGHEVVSFALDGRIAVAARYLATAYRTFGKANGAEKPNDADVLYWASQGILERALRHQVDWVIVVSAMYLHPDALILLRRAGIKVCTVLTESPYDDAPPQGQWRVAQHSDLVFTNERASITYLRQFNPQVCYLPHAYDPERHRPDAEDDVEVATHDVVFVGTGFWERCEVLAAVDWSGIDLGLYGIWGLLPREHPLRQHVHEGAVDNRLTAALYRKAKIGLNLYRQSIGFGRKAVRIAHAESLNPRALELAACGVFTVSDFRAEVHEVFGSLVPTFRTASELEKLVRRYLADEEARCDKAARLPAVVAGRTFDAMATQVVERLEVYSKGGNDVPGHSDAPGEPDPTRQGHDQSAGVLAQVPT